MLSDWYKNDENDAVWWKDTDSVGEFVFSFDRQKEFNLFADYPKELTAQEKRLFDKENPYWANFFKDRQRT